MFSMHKMYRYIYVYKREVEHCYNTVYCVIMHTAHKYVHTYYTCTYV